MPPPADYPPDFAARVKRLQVLIIAMAGGAAAFLIYALVRRSMVENLEKGTPFLTYVALGVGVALLIAYYMVPTLMADARRQRLAETTRPPGTATGSDAANLFSIYQVRLLVGAALLEAASFIVLVAYIMECHLRPGDPNEWLGGDNKGWLGALLFIGVLASLYPTVPKVERWIEEQRRLLAQDRKGAGQARTA